MAGGRANLFESQKCPAPGVYVKFENSKNQNVCVFFSMESFFFF
jgi:hypothetical protein